jgi:hypothetical protein
VDRSTARADESTSIGARSVMEMLEGVLTQASR